MCVFAHFACYSFSPRARVHPPLPPHDMVPATRLCTKRETATAQAQTGRPGPGKSVKVKKSTIEKKEDHGTTDSDNDKHALSHTGADIVAIELQALDFPALCARETTLASRSRGRVLDVGCATGRHSFELARDFDEVSRTHTHTHTNTHTHTHTHARKHFSRRVFAWRVIWQALRPAYQQASTKCRQRVCICVHERVREPTVARDQEPGVVPQRFYQS